MKIRINLSAVVTALIVMAAVSLLVIGVLTRLDRIVHGDLYNFGLRFSYRWAMPYWVNSGFVILLSWFNIIAAITLTYYVFKKRKSAPRLAAHQAAHHAMQVKASVEELVERPEELVEAQILDQYCESLSAPQIKSYDVRHPKDVIDSQC